MKMNDIVFIIGKYIPDPSEKPRIIEARISHIKHRQFVAYDLDENNHGIFNFSKKHIGKCVFTTRKAAEQALNALQ